MSHASITIRCPSTVHAHMFFSGDARRGYNDPIENAKNNLRKNHRGERVVDG